MSPIKRMLRRLPGFTNWRTANTWDAEYQSGRWAYLCGLEELGHYSIAAGYARLAKPGGILLDVGCGTGLLCRLLGRDALAEYVGMDLSQTALEQAERTHGALTRRFVCADFTEYEPDRQYDAIVFNESLYYAPAPALILKRYTGFLKPDGVFIISMYLPRRAATWKDVDQHCRTIDEVTLRHSSGRSWLCRLASPKL